MMTTADMIGLICIGFIAMSVGIFVFTITIRDEVAAPVMSVIIFLLGCFFCFGAVHQHGYDRAMVDHGYQWQPQKVQPGKWVKP